MKTIKDYILVVGIVISAVISGCKKFAEVNPPVTSITSGSVFANDVTAIGVVTGLYAQISKQEPNTQNSIMAISIFAGLSADELAILPGQSDLEYHAFYKNQVLSSSSAMPFWNPLFGISNSCTYVIEALNAQETKEHDNTSNLTLKVKNQLIGEAYFLRAFCYFYLTNIYGEVPLILDSDILKNSKLFRSPKPDVYKQVIADLKEAKKVLSDNFIKNDLIAISTERVRPTKWAATALLARAYLYNEQYVEAEMEASEVITNNALFELATLDGVFLKNSREAIWQLQPVSTGWNTGIGKYFILSGMPSTNGLNNKPFFLNEDLVNSFEMNDPRKLHWVNNITVSGTTYFYPYKYKKGAAFDSSVSSTGDMTEYLMMLRLGELYLIRADARLNQKNYSGCISDINLIRHRARNGDSLALPDILSTASEAELKQALVAERRSELFTEWGDRWFDLRRIGELDAVMKLETPRKSGVDWRSFQSLYPLSPSEMQSNPNLIQNPGYE